MNYTKRFLKRLGEGQARTLAQRRKGKYQFLKCCYGLDLNNYAVGEKNYLKITEINSESRNNHRNYV